MFKKKPKTNKQTASLTSPTHRIYSHTLTGKTVGKYLSSASLKQEMIFKTNVFCKHAKEG